MATTDSPELPSGAGLAAAIAVEPGDFGTNAPIRARGYWENVFLRFRRDTFAIAGGVWILFIIFVGFVGAPIAAHFLGHGPNEQFAGGLDSKTVLLVGPFTTISAADRKSVV